MFRLRRRCRRPILVLLQVHDLSVDISLLLKDIALFLCFHIDSLSKWTLLLLQDQCVLVRNGRIRSLVAALVHVALSRLTLLRLSFHKFEINLIRVVGHKLLGRRRVGSVQGLRDRLEIYGVPVNCV